MNKTKKFFLSTLVAAAAMAATAFAEDTTITVETVDKIKDAISTANTASGGTIDLGEVAYVYAAPLTTDADMVSITNAGTYTLTGGSGALLNYELEVNPDKASGDFVLSLNEAHVTMTKLTLRENATLSLTNSRLDYNGFISGSAYLSVYSNSQLNLTNSVLGYDPHKTGVADCEDYKHTGTNKDFFGPRISIYGGATITGSTIFTGPGQTTHEGFDVLGNAQVSMTDSMLHTNLINVGSSLESKRLTEGTDATNLSAILTLDNTDVDNIQYRGDYTSYSGIRVGATDMAGTLIIKNGSNVDMTVINYTDDREQGLNIGAKGTVQLSDSSLKVSKITNSGTFTADASTIVADTFTHSGTQATLDNVDLNASNFVNGEDSTDSYAVIGGTSKVRIDNLSGYYALRLADGAVLKDGTAVTGNSSVRALGNVSFGERSDDALVVDSFDNHGAGGKTITVNGTLEINKSDVAASSHWFGIYGGSDGNVTTLTGNGTINSNGFWNIFQLGAITVGEGLTINIADSYARDLRFTSADVTINGVINQKGSNNKLSALQSANVTVSGKNAALNIDDYLLVGYNTYKEYSDTTDAYKSTIKVENGATLSVGGTVYVNKDSRITVSDATFSAGTLNDNGVGAQLYITGTSVISGNEIVGDGKLRIGQVDSNGDGIADGFSENNVITLDVKEMSFTFGNINNATVKFTQDTSLTLTGTYGNGYLFATNSTLDLGGKTLTINGAFMHDSTIKNGTLNFNGEGGEAGWSNIVFQSNQSTIESDATVNVLTGSAISVYEDLKIAGTLNDTRTSGNAIIVGHADASDYTDGAVLTVSGENAKLATALSMTVYGANTEKGIESSSLVVENGGNVEIGGTLTNNGTVEVSEGATLTAVTIVNNGSITVNNATLNVTNLTGTGTLTMLGDSKFADSEGNAAGVEVAAGTKIEASAAGVAVSATGGSIVFTSVAKLDSETVEISTLAANESVAIAWDFSIEGIGDGESVTVETEIAKGLNTSDIKVFHKADDSTDWTDETANVDVAYDATTGKLSFTTNSFSSYAVAIPEPSTFGLLAGLGALFLVGARRRRR